MNFLKILSNLEKSVLSNLIVLFIVSLLFWTSITCLLPTLPSYIQSFGATAREVGFVMGCFAIGLLASRFWLGKLADQHSRKIVVVIGSVVSAIAPIGYILFDNIPALMVVRAFHGISIAAFSTGYNALVVDLSPVKHKGELMGYMSLSIPTGMAIGPAIGSYLETSTSYTILFSFSAISGFLSYFLANFVKEKNRSHFNRKLTMHSKTVAITDKFLDLCTNPSFVVPTLVLLLIGSLFGTLVSFLPLYIRDLNLDFNVGLFYTAAAIASFIIRILSGRASDKYGRGLFISVSILFYIASMILVTIGNSANTFVIAGILEGIGAGMIIPITLALISDRCHANQRGQIFAFCISGFDVGVALGGPVLGGFAASLGYQFIFATATGMAVIALFTFIGFANKDLTSSLLFATGKAPDFYALDEHKKRLI